MKRKRFVDLRGNVLDKYNNLEMLMNLAISMYYFKGANMDFILRVLHDPLFSSALKINLFLKIVKNTKKKRKDKFESRIRRMANIRNYFAHITPQYFDSGKEISIEEIGWAPHPKKPLERIDLEKEHEKFFELEKEVHPYMVSACKGLGVEFPARFLPSGDKK